jgi:hypothetical protein
LGYFFNFRKTVQSKQSPVGWKFAQSGHPDQKALCASKHAKNVQFSRHGRDLQFDVILKYTFARHESRLCSSSVVVNGTLGGGKVFPSNEIYTNTRTNINKVGIVVYVVKVIRVIRVTRQKIGKF